MPFPAIGVLKAFLKQSVVYGSRSTVLRPLGLMVTAFLSALLGSIYLDSPSWLIIMLSSIVCLSILLFLLTFVYLILKNPEFLRTEKYLIQKQVIEKGSIGDSFHGLFSPEEQTQVLEQHVDSNSESGETK